MLSTPRSYIMQRAPKYNLLPLSVLKLKRTTNRRNLITMADIATSTTTTTTARLASDETKIPTFSGFSDFNLDLSTLSPPSSPSTPTSPLPLFPASAVSHESTPRSSKTPSLFSQSYSLNDSSRPARKMSPSTLMMAPSVAATVLRGSWPLVRHVGRGTPVDKTRLVEWGTLGGEEVAEDGLLLSSVRSTSLDSISPRSQRPASPDWNLLVLPQTNIHSSTFPRSRSRMFDEPPPELPGIPVATGSSEEWSSLMQMMLKDTTSDPGKGESPNDENPAASGPGPGKNINSPPETDQKEDGPRTSSDAAINRNQACLTPEEIRQLDMELGNNLGLNDALNLGLSLHGGMNLFNLDIIPPDGGRADSPSVYPLDDETSQTSRPPSIHALEEAALENIPRAEVVQEDGVAVQGFKRTARTWWQRFIKGLRRVPSVMHFQRAE